MFVRVVTVLAVLAGAWGVSACGSGAGTADETAQPAPRGDDTVVEVTNHNWSDVTVYVLREGTDTRVRLGTVTSMTTSRFEVPPTVVPRGGSIRLQADPVGSSRGHTTHPIPVSPGQRVEWQVENNLNLSSVSVW